MVKRFKTVFTILFIFFSIAASVEAKEWMGTDDTDWDNGDNWFPVGVPGENDEVLIGSNANYDPVIENKFSLTPGPKNVKIKKLTIENNKTLEIILKDYNVTLECTGGINVKGKIKLTHKWAVGSGLLAEMVDITGGDNSKIELKEDVSGLSKYRTVLIPNINKVKKLSIEGQTDYFILNNDLDISGLFENNIASPTATFPDKGFNANGHTVTFSGTDSEIRGGEVPTFWNLTIAQNRKLTLVRDIKIDGTFTKNGDFQANNQTVTFTGTDSRIAGSSEPTFFGLTIANSVALKLDRPTVKISGTFTNEGTFVHNNQEVIFNGSSSQIAGTVATNFYKLTVESGTLTLGKGITVNGTLTNKNGATFNAHVHNITLNDTFTNRGTFNSGASNTITFTGSAFTNSGTFTAGTNNTVTLSPASGTVTITGTDNAGATTFNKLSLTNAGGKTLVINNKITVTGSLDISGTPPNNLLNIKGPGEITLGNNQTASLTPLPPKGYYLRVHTDIPITAGHTYTVKESAAAEGSGIPIAAGNPKNWIFGDYSGTLTWTGLDNADWTNVKNWGPNAVPNKNTDIIIPKLPNNPPKYPNLGTGIDPNAKAKSVSIEPKALLDLGSHLIEDGGGAGAATCPITNNGTLKMTGTPDQKTWLADTDAADKITHANHSIIEYNIPASSTPSVIWAGPYENLKVRSLGAPIEIKNDSNTAFEKLTVQKDFTLDKGSATVNTKALAVEINRHAYLNAAAEFDISSMEVKENTLIAAPAASEIKFNNYLKTKSFVLLSGKVTLGNNAAANENSALYATGDIVLFGSAYNANDTASDPSGTSGLFTYYHPKRDGITALPSVTIFPGTAPDGKPLFDTDKNPVVTAGSFSDLTGKKLKAGKNFYANGIELKAETGTDPFWALEIPDNNSALSAFAEAYFTKVANCRTTGGSVAAAEGCRDDGANRTSWAFARPTIAEAYTYSDDTIYVKFNKKIENSNGEIAKAINAGRIRFSGNAFVFSQVLEVITIGTQKKPGGPLPNNVDVDEFFLRTNGQRWNTDATGTYEGSNQSTDRGGAPPYEPAQDKNPRHHHNTRPNLTIYKATTSWYEVLRDEHKNRIRHYAGGAADTTGDNGKIYGKVEDRCPPVLAAVYIGQEPHTEGSSQPKYDAHNFIEFRYSEPVFIDGISNNSAIATGAQYIRATDTIGNIETGSGGTITEIKGLATFSNGKLVTGKHGESAGSVHAVYRTSAMRVTTAPPPGSPSGRECRVRISVAGWVDGSDNWIGYITEAEAPSGSAVPVYTEPSPNPQNTANVRTREPTPLDPSNPSSGPLKNWEKLDAQFKPKIYASSAVGIPEVAGWDTSPPVFAKVSDDGTQWQDSSNMNREITAYSASSQFADKIEFHFFDNTPDYGSINLWWRTAGALTERPGWNTVSNRYDSYGGSRFTDPNRTKGGIRACTLPAADKVKDVFIFDAEKPEFNEALQKFTGTDAAYPLTLSQKAQNEAIFGSLPSGFSEQDSLYLQLRISPSSAPLKFPVTEIFTVAYRGIDAYPANGGHITDLAGNLMKSCSGAKSIDASPPNIALTAAPVGLNQIYILFTSQIDTSPEKLAKIPGNLEIIDKPAGSTVEIDPSVPARVRTDTKTATGIIVSLTEPVAYGIISQAKLRIKKDADNRIHIYPKLGAYPAFEGHKHVISDFALNIIRPLFAYDEKKLDDGTSGFITAGIYGGTSQAVRLFDGSGVPGNTVLEKEDITVHLAVENVSSTDSAAPKTLEMYIENNPNPASVSVNLNKATNLGSRVWLPGITGLPPGAVSGLSVLSPEENPCSANEAVLLFPTVAGGFKYEFKLFNNPLTVPLSPNFLNYPAGSRAEFLFAIKDGNNDYILIDHDCDDGGSTPTPKIPLYALRLKDPNDPASIDLWSLDIASIKRQAGGVSILNNVINVETDEKCTIAVTAEKAGSLSVMVMTLDGDVVKVLYSGRAEEGEHFYRWNGTNKNGEAVARGMYFIRVIGPDIDETRKVMAVKE